MLAVVIAIAWPSNWPSWPRDKAREPAASATSLAPDAGAHSLRAADPGASWHDPGSLASADQEEPDEGDDARTSSPMPAPPIPGDLPSLIPAALAGPGPAPAARRPRAGTKIRLRC